MYNNNSHQDTQKILELSKLYAELNLDVLVKMVEAHNLNLKKQIQELQNV